MKILILILCITILVSALPRSLPIFNCEQLLNRDPTKNYHLKFDIDCFGFNMTTTGTYNSVTLDGRGHTIKGLTMWATTSNFGLMGEAINAVITNLVISDSLFVISPASGSTLSNFGFFVGYGHNGGNITNCKSFNNKIILNNPSTSTATIQNIGGIAGQTYSGFNSWNLWTEDVVFQFNGNGGTSIQNVGGNIGYNQHSNDLSDFTTISTQIIFVGGITIANVGGNFGRDCNSGQLTRVRSVQNTIIAPGASAIGGNIGSSGSDVISDLASSFNKLIGNCCGGNVGQFESGAPSSLTSCENTFVCSTAGGNFGYLTSDVTNGFISVGNTFIGASTTANDYTGNDNYDGGRTNCFTSGNVFMNGATDATFSKFSCTHSVPNNLTCLRVPIREEFRFHFLNQYENSYKRNTLLSEKKELGKNNKSEQTTTNSQKTEKKTQ